MNKICGPAVLAVSLFAVAAAIPDAAHACNVQLGSPNSCSQYCDGDLIDGPEIISCETYVRRKRDQRGPALPPRAAEGHVNSQQIQIIRDTAAAICNTIKEAKGQKNDVQIAGDVQLKLNGLIGKVVNVGAAGGGSITREEFEGLSRDAAASALEGDRGCRERVFNKMFDKLGAAQELLVRVSAKRGLIGTVPDALDRHRAGPIAAHA